MSPVCCLSPMGAAFIALKTHVRIRTPHPVLKNICTEDTLNKPMCKFAHRFFSSRQRASRRFHGSLSVVLAVLFRKLAGVNRIPSRMHGKKQKPFFSVFEKVPRSTFIVTRACPKINRQNDTLTFFSTWHYSKIECLCVYCCTFAHAVGTASAKMQQLRST